ncbi:DNA polymerase III subunit beta [Candidatus Sulfotelmatomonas gaucii]|uniref:Beta sliding clamp n=1 Tax=Candidatus Sulfuritelmatomonas gaucii TaxID=2043161 RepID=A0A2N9L312_9BACT|nr:DNA polymerase III subunit beta [Candidatus Sulfotelmatomonas gaucii]
MPSVESEVEKPAAQGAAMEITVSRQDLVKELTATQSVVERKTTIPILSNFLIEADGDRLNITATDLDQAIRTSAAVKVKKAGTCTIPARKLYDYIKLLPDGDISIKLLENHWVQIRSGRSNTKMVGMARANYPQVPEFPTVAVTSIPLAALRALIARTIFAISNEESRYTLNGALLVLKAESLAMVATDGHRLAFVEKPGETLEGISGEKRVLIPRKALQELQVLLSSTEAEKVEFADDEHTLFFRVGHRTLSSRKLSGQFPNFEAVMPRDNTKFAVVRSSELSAAIQRVAQFADERSGAIRLRLEDNELKISANSTESGESEDTIDTPYASEPIVVGFNSVYILDFLRALDNAGEVRLEFKDAQSAGQMRPEDPDAEYKYRYVLMPMRI